MSSPVLLMENITKIYPNGFVANQNVTLSVNKGEIHALMGENGAGKTTLMKVLFGIETSEEGRILINGEEVKINNPQHAISLGIGMVHQHFMLVDSLSVTENLIIGMEKKTFGNFGLLDLKYSENLVKEIGEKFNFKINPKAKIKDLTVGQKQKVEILKALIRGAKILILDEPTAVLTPQETDELFQQLKLMKNDGYTIVFISHKLNEVMEICDKITVLRRGKFIGSRDIEGMTEKDISKMMVGRDVILNIDKEKNKPKKTILKVRNLEKLNNDGKKVLNNINFDLREGEILGIAGVEGNGQTELSEALTGMSGFETGDIVLNGKSLKGKDIRSIRETGLAHISEDRMTYGIAQNSSIWENLISDRYFKKSFGNIFLKFDTIEKFAKEAVDNFKVRCDDIFQPIKMLSGGNIQKVVVAREFTSNANFIVANQPTRGVDVGATELIRRELIRLTREEDKGVLLISADLNEVLELSDSLVVMVDGEIVGYFEDASKVDEYELGNYMLGIERHSKEEIGRLLYEH